jgi:predicted lipid-binding transport protein (Tim44 family)
LPSGEPFDPSLILFAALAVFVLWRLRSVLGARTDRDSPAASGRFEPRRAAPPAPAPLPGAPPADGAPVLAADRWKGLAEPGGAAWSGLDAIAAADPAFSGKAFVDGARKAYEMIVAAFAKGDRDTLRGLLSKEVFDNFAGEIAGREARGETEETAVVSIDSATVDAASADARALQITIRFVGKLMSARRNSAGEIILGSLDQAERAVDIWTFARDPRSDNPNWKLVATETGQ